MDLVTLIAACALSVQPRRAPVVTPAVMHALIWEQSRGIPWSFSGPQAHQTQVHPTLRDAAHAARDERPANTFLRIGLTGLPAKSRSVSAAMFMPCQNIARATQLIEDLATRCSRRRRPDASIDCAIAVYRGSWGAPDYARYADIGIIHIMPSSGLCRADAVSPDREAFISAACRHNQRPSR
jgi:hypothetical protein